MSGGWATSHPAFAGLDAKAIARLERLQPAEAAAGTVLFRPGDAVKGYVIVLSGRVAVRLSGPTGRDLLLYAVEPGQACIQSTLGLLGGDKDYSAEAVTETASRLVLLPRADFLGLLDSSPAFRALVFTAFAERMQSMMHLLEKLTFQRVEARLARELLTRATASDVIEITHQDLATAIGSAREVVSRRLEGLARSGAVQLERGNVRLLDRARLETLADDGGL